MCGYLELNLTLDRQISQGVEWSKNSEIGVGGLRRWRPWAKLISQALWDAQGVDNFAGRL